MKEPAGEVTQVSLRKHPKAKHWMAVIQRYPQGVRVVVETQHHWYRWAKIKKAR